MKHQTQPLDVPLRNKRNGWSQNPMMSATFRFGAGDAHESKRLRPAWPRALLVDGVLIGKRWNLGTRGDREFATNGRRIRIVLQASATEIRSEAYVDGQLRQDGIRRLPHVTLMMELAPQLIPNPSQSVHAAARTG